MRGFNEGCTSVRAARIEIVEIAAAEPGPDEVLVEVRYVGMCGSDLNAYRGTFPLMRYPRILGHEASGIVVARGTAVPDRIAEGTLVMFSPYSECGICTACRAGRPNCCQFNETMGLQRDGALTRLVAIPVSKVFTSDILTLQELALTEPLSVGYHAANRGRISEADTVLVMGCGVVGIGVIAARPAKARRSSPAISTTASWPTHSVSAPATPSTRRVRTCWTPFASSPTATESSVAVEAVGLPQTFRLAVEAVAFAGRVVYVGYAKKDVSYDTALFVRKELDICAAQRPARLPRRHQDAGKARPAIPDLITRSLRAGGRCAARLGCRSAALYQGDGGRNGLISQIGRERVLWRPFMT